MCISLSLYIYIYIYAYDISFMYIRARPGDVFRGSPAPASPCSSSG